MTRNLFVKALGMLGLISISVGPAAGAVYMCGDVPLDLTNRLEDPSEKKARLLSAKLGVKRVGAPGRYY